eukprot:COSAG02_NODE_3346_length_6896_cov_18.050611_1_plen_167_part_00
MSDTGTLQVFLVTMDDTPTLKPASDQDKGGKEFVHNHHSWHHNDKQHVNVAQLVKLNTQLHKSSKKYKVCVKSATVYKRLQTGKDRFQLDENPEPNLTRGEVIEESKHEMHPEPKLDGLEVVILPTTNESSSAEGKVRWVQCTDGRWVPEHVGGKVQLERVVSWHC